MTKYKEIIASNMDDLKLSLIDFGNSLECYKIINHKLEKFKDCFVLTVEYI